MPEIISSVVPGLSCAVFCKIAFGLRHACQSGTDVDSISFNSIMSSAEKAACWLPALQCFGDIGLCRIQKSLISFNVPCLALSSTMMLRWHGSLHEACWLEAAISACEKFGQWHAALSLCRGAWLHGIPGDVVTLGSLVDKLRECC